MALKDIKSNATPRRMRSRLYVFGVSTFAVALLIMAFVNPNDVSNVSRAVIRVSSELGPEGISPISERISSIAFLRDVGAHYGSTEGVDLLETEGVLDRWASQIREALIIEDFPMIAQGETQGDVGTVESALTDDRQVDVILRYQGADEGESLSVMESLLATLGSINAEGLTGESTESRMRVLAAERRLGQAKQALELYVNEGLARAQAEASGDNAHRPVSLHASGDSGIPQLPSPVAMADPVLELTPSSAATDGYDTREDEDWLAEQKAIDQEHNLIRNPEFDLLVRALVRSQAERQQLMIDFEPTHAAIRRVESEIAPA